MAAKQDNVSDKPTEMLLHEERILITHFLV